MLTVLFNINEVSNVTEKIWHLVVVIVKLLSVSSLKVLVTSVKTFKTNKIA